MNSYVVEFQTVFLPDLILDYLLFGLQVFLSCDVESLEVMECNFVWHFVTFEIWKEIYVFLKKHKPGTGIIFSKKACID